MTLVETTFPIVAGLVTSFFTGPYWGAMVIAFVASFTRTAFEDQCGNSHTVCFRRWMRFFMMATGISFLMVSVSAWIALPSHPAIVAAGFFACFAEETLQALKALPKRIINKMIQDVTK